jgi:hypothetical protein
MNTRLAFAGRRRTNNLKAGSWQARTAFGKFSVENDIFSFISKHSSVTLRAAGIKTSSSAQSRLDSLKIHERLPGWSRTGFITSVRNSERRAPFVT